MKTMMRGVQRRLCSSKLPAKTLYDKLEAGGISAYFGVPDSLLKDVCAYITDTAGDNNICTANEGSAVSMALGHYLATGQVPCVYLQNSGFGNTVNPILSLAHEKVYQVPMLLLIGWRGEPSIKDEPQHVAQGALQEGLLDACEIPYSVLPTTPEGVDEVLAKAQAHFKEKRAPYALLVRKNTFEGYKLQTTVKTDFEMSRETAIKTILDTIDATDAVVSTTGMPSREVFEHRADTDANHSRDFLTVGGMGHCSMIAAGIALQRPEKQVFVIDGDGAAIMHLGGLTTVGGLATQRGAYKNYKHIILNNGAHDSVGGQPTMGFDVNFPSIAANCGYKVIGKGIVDTKAELQEAVSYMREADGPCVLEVRINKGARKDIGRPTTTPVQNKNALMDFLGAKGI
eukprot:TRINITY_DN7981_c0_g1_i1.p2 TRINITY_DN7981_c0_g1~~TRINITY_DN7981_c0_g1_i1.p2  ORF type:complete len:417 (+),score=167.69 TRINITY_DN7981_c0_g1_i1:53-1252(+)